MTRVTTTIDRRFSAPNAEPTSWAETELILRDAQLSWLTTVRADGRPHVTPLVAVWLDDAVFFSTGAYEQKYRNLQTNPHVVLTTGAATWDSGVDVMVEGVAVEEHDDALLQRVADAFARKWDGESWLYRVRDGHFTHDVGDEHPDAAAMVFRVAPAKVLAFAKGTFAQTRHRFG